METVFLQSLRAESAQAAPGTACTAAFLWDMSNYYEHVNHELLWLRALETDFHCRARQSPSINTAGDDTWDWQEWHKTHSSRDAG